MMESARQLCYPEAMHNRVHHPSLSTRPTPDAGRRALLAALAVLIAGLLGLRGALSAEAVVISPGLVLLQPCADTPGSVLTLFGLNWQPLQPVALTLNGATLPPATADADGRFVVSLIAPPLSPTVVLNAVQGNVAVGTGFVMPCAPDFTASSARGLVQGPNGQPVAGATVYSVDPVIGSLIAITGADGRFAFDGLTQVLSYRMATCVAWNGALRSAAALISAPHPDIRLTLALDPDGVCDDPIPIVTSCPLAVSAPPQVGDVALAVQGDLGARVTVSDRTTGVLLGSAILQPGGPPPCTGAAAIPLTSPLIPEQVLEVRTADGQLRIVYLPADVAPQLVVLPFCSDAPLDELIVVGNRWPVGAPVALAWDGVPVGVADPDDTGYFLQTIAVGSIGEGVHGLVGVSGNRRAVGLLQRPCPAGAPERAIAGTVYADLNGIWTPLHGAQIALSRAPFGRVDAAVSFPNGSYRFEPLIVADFELTACAQRDGVVFTAGPVGVTAPAAEADLYLRPTPGADCAALPLPPPPPVDLTIGRPAVSVVSLDRWEVTVGIANTGPADVTRGFFVDVFVQEQTAEPRFNPGATVGYVYVPGLAAGASAEVRIAARAPYPLGVPQTVSAVIDTTGLIPETDETNNRAAAPFSAPRQIDLVAVYALAFDHPAFSDKNLAPQFPATLTGLINASVGAVDKLAVVLVDLGGVGDTRIVAVYNGRADYVRGLPNSAAQLDPTLTEYDMGDGATLGGFLTWVRANFPAPTTTFSFIGHGAALMPAIDVAPSGGPLRGAPTGPLPLPSWVVATPDYTDYHPISMISPHDLRVALAQATADGAQPFAVVDLVHCFSLSVEQAYELAPYADFITGSPNFAYFDAVLPGGAFAALDATQPPVWNAAALIAAYDALLPQEGYPRLLAAVETDALSAVKSRWDEVARQVLLALQRDREGTRRQLLAAYRAAPKYDTTFCAADWELREPDALVDLAGFARALAQQFGRSSPVGLAAGLAAAQTERAVPIRRAVDGQPWFAGPGASAWTWTHAAGLALYADLQGVERDDQVALSWQAAWYDGAATAENPHPFQFLQGPVVWSSVLQAYWADIPTVAEGCLTTFPPNRDTGELSVQAVLNPVVEEAVVGRSLTPRAAVRSAGELRNTLVSFSIEQAGATVYSATVGTGYLFTGTHVIAADAAWIPAVAAPYTVTVVVDGPNVVAEADEQDNRAEFAGRVRATAELPPPPQVALDGDRQWITERAVTLVNRERAPTGTWRVRIYQFAGVETGVAQPVLLADQAWTPVAGGNSVPLPVALQPGPVQMLIWSVVGGQVSAQPVDLRFNYAPAGAMLAAGAVTCYPFTAAAGRPLALRLNTPDAQDANLFVWYPGSIGRANLIGARPGDDELVIENAPLTGEYLACVRGETPGGVSYTLSAATGGHPTVGENDPTVPQPAARYHLQAALPVIETAVPLGVALTMQEATAERPALVALSGALLAGLVALWWVARWPGGPETPPDGRRPVV